MPNTVVYEMNNFIDIFRVNFVEEKGPNFVISLVLKQVPSHFKRRIKKSRIWSDRLQNFIFVQ